LNSDNELKRRLAKRDAPRPKTESELAFKKQQVRMRKEALIKYEMAQEKFKDKPTIEKTLL